MKPEAKNNVAYIDGANLHNGVKSLDWSFDYARFRVWLRDKYGVESAYIFLGMMPKYKELYTKLQDFGFKIIFKEVVYDGDGKPKGNCDADIVVHAMEGAYESMYEKAVLVSSDGDYASLVKFLLSKDKMITVISPYPTEKCSVLLKRTGVNIANIPGLRKKLEYRK